MLEPIAKIYRLVLRLVVTTVLVLCISNCGKPSSSNPLFKKLVDIAESTELPRESDIGKLVYGFEVTDQVCPEVTRDALDEMLRVTGGRPKFQHLGPEAPFNQNSDEWTISYSPSFGWVKFATVNLDSATNACSAWINLSGP